MKNRLILLLLASAGTAMCADQFDQIVSTIESHYGVKRLHIPLMGLAGFVVKVAHPAGASGFKLAVFPDMGSASGYGDWDDLDSMFERLAGSGLHPVVKVRSRHGEATYIFTGEIRKNTRLLIATFDHNEATVVEATVTMDRLLQTLGAPQDASHTFLIKHESW